MASSPDGTRVLTGSYDNTARLWDASTGAVLRTFTGHTSEVYSVAFSPDGTRVLTGSSDGTARLWDADLTRERVLIVAGGGPYPTNAIGNQTRLLAEQAHLASTLRGIDPADVVYLSSFETREQNPLVDGAASVAGIQAALDELAGGTRQLTMFLFDHGEYDAGAAEWVFYVDANRSPREVLTGPQLDAMLDRAQRDGLRDLVVVIDACYAGGMLRQAAGVPPDAIRNARRVMISSTTDNRLANYGGGAGQPTLSFSYFLLSGLARGLTVRGAFEAARETIVSLNVPASAPQSPWLDDDGNAAFTAEDGVVASRLVLGTTVPFGLNPAEIASIQPNLVLESPTDVVLQAVVTDGIVHDVEATVTWSRAFYAEDTPISQLTTIPLRRVGSTRTWQAVINNYDFPGDGVYTVVHTAYRNDPLRPDLRFSSSPKVMTIRLGDADAPPVERPRSAGPKMLIVAAGGTAPSNPFGPQFRLLADQVHEAASLRGIPPEDVWYASSYETTAENPTVDGPATIAEIGRALTEWAPPAAQLTVYIVGPGAEAPDGGARVILDGGESLDAAALSPLLDAAQNAGIAELLLIVEADRSGGFVQRCSGRSAQWSRFVVASTAPTGVAIVKGRENRPPLSFSEFLFGKLAAGVDLWSSFVAARSTIMALRLPRLSPQSPWFDDTGDGVFTGQDGTAARSFLFGDVPPYGALEPEILAVGPDVQLSTRESVTLVAIIGPGRVDAVEAALAGPGDVLGVISLGRAADGTWQGEIPAAALAPTGEHTVVYTAYRNEPLTEVVRYASPPRVQTIRVGSSNPVLDCLLGSAPAGDLDPNQDGVLDAADLVETGR